jgi:hypothetical protein
MLRSLSAWHVTFFLSKCDTGERRVNVIEFLQLATLYDKPLDFSLISPNRGQQDRVVRSK